MNTEIANAVNAAGDKAQYDTRVKRLLAQKSIDVYKRQVPINVTYLQGADDIIKFMEKRKKTDGISK